MKRLMIAAAALALAACDHQAPAPAADTAETAAPVEISAPAGTYALDPSHASLSFRINHLGLSNYVVRFTRFNGVLTLDPANIAASSIEFTVDPSSVRTDYPLNYRQTHPQSQFSNWDEDLSRSQNFFNTGQFPEAAFKSTAVEATGANTARVTGDLTLLGQTHPATFDVTYVGSMATHPFTNAGAIGLSATGTIDRSQWGMNFGLPQNDQPGFLGDAVTIEFNGEFMQQAAPASEAAPAAETPAPADAAKN
ncbi:MAG: polyisoprenoid-binding protein [Alphaproteobacteria bacterium]|nr:polyisoprenoid-binding protein [Alphaproteobacteria bacterium]